MCSQLKKKIQYRVQCFWTQSKLLFNKMLQLAKMFELGCLKITYLFKFKKIIVPIPYIDYAPTLY